jgi:hypothetical protein
MDDAPPNKPGVPKTVSDETTLDQTPDAAAEASPAKSDAKTEASREVEPDEQAATTQSATTPPREPTTSETMYCYPLRFPERYGEQALTTELGIRLAGNPADGTRPTEGKTPGKVIWVDAGDEVLAHLDSLKIRLLDSLIVASIDLECDQTGRTPLVCVFATGKGSDEAGLLVTTDELPRGNALLAARWGEVVQNAIWSVLTNLLRDHADERRIVPVGLSASTGALQLLTAPSLTLYSAPQGGGQ